MLRNLVCCVTTFTQWVSDTRLCDYSISIIYDDILDIHLPSKCFYVCNCLSRSLDKDQNISRLTVVENS